MDWKKMKTPEVPNDVIEIWREWAEGPSLEDFYDAVGAYFEATLGRTSGPVEAYEEERKAVDATG